MIAYDVKDVKSTEFPLSNENTTPLNDPSLSYQVGYQLPVNDFLSNYNDVSDLYINPPLDMEDIHSHRNFPLEYDPQLGSSNNLAIDHFLNNSTCDPICAKPRHKKKRRTNKRSEKTEDLGIQLNYPTENVLENMQFSIENKIHSDEDRRLRKKLQKLKREKTIQDGGLGVMSKKEFRKTCMICLYEFQSEGNYQTDQLRHQQSFGDLDQPVRCPICHERIETKCMVTSHFAEKHSNQNITCCCECLEVIPKGSNRLRRHILKAHHSATEKQVCPECGQECAGNAKLEIHMAETHSDKKAAVCEECGKTFGHLKVYQQHLRRHHNPRDLQCLQCDKKFEHRQQAIDHLVVHTGIKPYKCVQCNYVSYRISNVICIHFMKCHGRKGVSATDLSTDIVERDRMMEIARSGVQEIVKRSMHIKTNIHTASYYLIPANYPSSIFNRYGR